MRIPIWISNRHIHLSKEDAEILFGKNYTFKKRKELSQKDQYAYEEILTIKWDAWEISHVRILWPHRKETQIEILTEDQFVLGTNAPLRLSWDLKWTPGITLIWPKATHTTKNGLIIAKRHIHLSPQQAKELKVIEWDNIKIKTEWERAVIFDNVIVRIFDRYDKDFHIDREEWNAAGLKTGDFWTIIT